LISLAATSRKLLATLLLWVACMTAMVGCVLPQDDQVIPERPPIANRPVRVVSGSPRPGQRETQVRFGQNCPREGQEFSIRVSDPDRMDTIRANWFIDPDERYVVAPTRPVFQGNSGTLLPPTDERLITSPGSLRMAFPQFVDGQKHRVEVVVTDGEFFEASFVDPNTMEPRPSLDVRRDPLRTEEGVFDVPAFRDEHVWLVEFSGAPCP
jgi:hypothetical protein